MKSIVKLVLIVVFSVLILACNGEDNSTVEVVGDAKSAQLVVASDIATEKSNATATLEGREIHVNGIVEKKKKKAKDGSEGHLVYIIHTVAGEKFRLPEFVSAETYVGKNVAADLFVVDKEGKAGKQKTIVMSVGSITVTSGE